MSVFSFSEAHDLLRRELRKFAQKEIVPGAREEPRPDRTVRDLVRKVGDAGYLGVNIPAKYGGMTAEWVDWVSWGITMEELARADPVLGLAFLMPMIANQLLAKSSEETKQQWLTPIIRGQKLTCFALTEPECGSDAAAIKMRAVKDKDYYILTGEKTAITLGMYADVAIVFAKTDMSRGLKGTSCFLVPLDLPGIARSPFSDMGLRAAGRASITMDDVRIPAKYLLGEEGRGFYMAMEQFDFMRIGLGLAALAQAQTALEETMDYAKQRIAFGQPLARFEAVSFKIAEAATLIEAGRCLCYHSFSLIDQGLSHTKEAAMCKWWCPRTAAEIVHNCLLIFGHIGYSDEHSISQRLRDVIAFEIADGTADIMKIIISRELMGREFRPY